MLNVRSDFPILNRKINGKQLIYLDNSATTQKPQIVIEAVSNFYKNHNSNIHRAIHTLADESTTMYEETRIKLTKLINSSKEEIVFTRNTTEAINLVCNSYLKTFLKQGDLILVSEMEHHSNFVPYIEIHGINNIEFVKVTDEFELDLNDLYEKVKNPKSKFLALTHISNVLGTVNPIKDIISEVRRVNPEIRVLIDGAQSIQSEIIDVKELDCDFFVFSSHKMLGPTGVGVLYGKKEILEKMPPFLYGGDMIREVHKEIIEWNDLPYKFEAGTPNIVDVIGLGAAIDYINTLGIKNIKAHLEELSEYGLKELKKLDFLKLIGPKNAQNRKPIFAFTIEKIHPHDIAQILDSEGIAVRSGLHCAQPLHDRFNLGATARASLYVYNTKEDIDKLVEGLKLVKNTFKT